MRLHITLATAAALTLTATTINAAPKSTPPLAPSSKWQLDYGPTECRLLRSFGEGRDQVTAQFSQIVPGPSLEFALLGRGVPATPAPVAASLSTTTVQPVDASAQGFALSGSPLSTLRVQSSGPLREAIARDIVQAKPTRLGVKFIRGYDVALDLGQMNAPLLALDRCMDDLVKTWGLDPAEQRARRTGPEPVVDPATWFRAGDYPLELRQEPGLVIIRLSVGANGAVTSCAVAKAGGDKAFEDLTCRLATERARFAPAISASGRPIASYWAKRIRWQPGAPFVMRGG